MAALKALGAALVTIVVLGLLLAATNKPVDSISLAVMLLLVIAVGFGTYRQARRAQASSDGTARARDRWIT